jgi:hypothetical protein
MLFVDTITQAQIALERIQTHQKQLWDDWKLVGKAILKIRDDARRISGADSGRGYSTEFSKLLSEYKFDEKYLTKTVRCDLLNVMDDLDAIERWRKKQKNFEGLNHPSYLWRIYSGTINQETEPQKNQRHRRNNFKPINRHTGHERIEWYTPPKYIQLARKALGTIDLDPATCKQAQGWIKARKFYTKRDDGLKQPWAENVFCNPPYASSLISQFVHKLCSEFDGGNITAAIILTNATIDTKWCQTLLNRCNSICLVRGRIKFGNKGGVIPSQTQPLLGQAFFYIGRNVEKFEDVFSTVGTCVRVSKAFKH